MARPPSQLPNFVLRCEYGMFVDLMRTGQFDVEPTDIVRVGSVKWYHFYLYDHSTYEQSECWVKRVVGNNRNSDDGGKITQLTFVAPKEGKEPTLKDIDNSAVLTISGLSLDFDDFIAAMSQSSTSDRYAYMVSLFDGDVNITSDKGGDNIEVGTGGKATITGGGGNDTVWIWQQKDIDFDGGKGSDTLRFEYLSGYVEQPASGAIVDLSTGTATNPYGGTIKFANVENVVGQFGASNDLRGDDNANRLQSGTLADTLHGLGGNDSIYVKYNASAGARATQADGGTGTDTLTAELTYMEPFIGSGFEQQSINRLDLTNQANNTATFKGGTFENFEVFKVIQDFNTLFHFIGSEAVEKVYGTGFEDDFDGGGATIFLRAVSQRMSSRAGRAPIGSGSATQPIPTPRAATRSPISPTPRAT